MIALLRVGLAWLCFGLGDAVSRLMPGRDWRWLYPVYAWLMRTSDRLQGDDVRGPWKNA